jgi:hypothetical protein
MAISKKLQLGSDAIKKYRIDHDNLVKEENGTFDHREIYNTLITRLAIIGYNTIGEVFADDKKEADLIGSDPTYKSLDSKESV